MCAELLKYKNGYIPICRLNLGIHYHLIINSYNQVFDAYLESVHKVAYF